MILNGEFQIKKGVEIQPRVEMEQFSARASMRFINSKPEEIDENIIKTLEDCGKLTGADKIYINLKGKSEYEWIPEYEWLNTEQAKYRRFNEPVLFDGFNYWNATLEKRDTIYVTNCYDLPPEAIAEKRFLISHGIRSTLIVPIVLQERVIGLFGLECYRDETYCSDDVRSVLKTVANMLALVLDRVRLEKESGYQLQFRKLISEIASGFVNIHGDEFDSIIADSIKKIGLFFQADRSCLLTYNQETDTYSLSHEWVADGISQTKGFIKNLSLVHFPWWTKFVDSSNIIYINNVDELPEEALNEKKFLSNLNIKSVLGLPIYIQGAPYGLLAVNYANRQSNLNEEQISSFQLLHENEYFGFVGFDSVSNTHTYTEKEIKILNVFAQMLVNVDQRKKMQQRLIQSREEANRANRAKSIFLANMSHEIRTPLNGVIGFMDLLNHTELTTEQQNYIESALKSAESLMSIINDILDLSKVEAGKLELEEVMSNLFEVVRHAVDMIRYSARKKGLEMNLIIEDNVPEFAVFDPLRLKQILVNLISNAVKFTANGKVTIKISFAKKEGSLPQKGIFRFEVEDTGIGISESKKNHLFKAFSQIDNAITRQYGGTGLGLIISNMLARKMGSYIDFVSKEGEGSRFYFSIEKEYTEKRMKGDDMRITVTENKIEPNASKIFKILLAEDTELNRLLVKAILRKIYPNVEIIDAVNGNEAVVKFMETKPDIVFMDIQMPFKSGFEATREIRAFENSNDKRVPIVALTASVVEGTEQKCLLAGMDFYISKPFRDYEIKECITRFIN
ncbi:MAG: hybrid sensor histidine kinase/response regulator [Balneolaceae bacterium]|nr:MAG: hybrid sensor histidine kinase/response regulator [Balneolaceae bacterium]